MSNEDEKADARRAITTQGLAQPATQEGPSLLDSITTKLASIGSQTAGWAADRVHDSLQDAVGRILGGEVSSPEQSTTYEDQAREQEQGRDR